MAIQKQQIDYKKYISYLLIAYAFSFPVSKAATNLFEVLAILLWIIEGNWQEKFMLYKKNLLSIAIALLIGFSLLSILWHGNTEETFKYVAKYRHLLIIFVFYTSFDKKYIQHVLSAFLFGMLISEIVSYGIFFELIHYKNISPSDPTPFMSHMTYSSVLAFTSTILLIRLFNSSKLRQKIIYGLFFITLISNLFINGGRTGQIIFILLIVILFFLYIKSKVKAFVLSTTLLLLIFSVASSLSPNFIERMHLLQSGIENAIYNHNFEESGGARASLWIVGIENFRDNLLLGTGIGKDMDNIKYYSQKNNFNVDFMKDFGDNHNAFITLSVQLGIIGLFISLLLIYSILMLKFTHKENRDMSIMFSITFIIFSLTHNTLHTMNPMVFFALFGGFFNALSKSANKREVS